MSQHGVGHLDPELQGEDQAYPETRVSLQVCSRSGIFDFFVI
jgi:hypothetical protein